MAEVTASSPASPILTIAGSDPSGGAGIQADLKTFAAIGVYGCAAITCLTAQNTMVVDSFLPVAPEFVRKQIELVLSDIRPSHIKIGMVGNGGIASAIADSLTDFSGQIVYDPVLRSSSGNNLFSDDNLGQVHRLLSRATVITPNSSELATITGMKCTDQLGATEAAKALLLEFPNLNAVVVTGGHIEENKTSVTDLLFIKNKSNEIVKYASTHPRIKTTNIHGTGCTFASAMAAYHLLSGSLEKAFRLAVIFIDEIIKASAFHTIGHGSGPLLHHLHQRPDQL